MDAKVGRRDFIKGGAAAATGAAVFGGPHRAWASGKKLRLGFIGVGNRGGQLLAPCLGMEDIEVTALCDVYKPHLEKWRKDVGGAVFRTGDFREVLKRADVDAVVIATPDHWHALQTILACDAGKDVYVEKPLSQTIVEGRRMVEAARRNNRVVQVGTQRRSSSVYPKLAEFIASGGIGKVTIAKCSRAANMFPEGIGNAPDSDPPAELDWDMWLGPRAWRPYNVNIAPYKFRWWKDYSSQMGNWGVHYFDVIRWVLGETAPVSVSAHGGRYVLSDSRTIPDTLEAIFEFASGRLMTFAQYEACSGSDQARGEIELRGALGTVYAGDDGIEVVPGKGGQFDKWENKIEPQKIKIDSGGDLTALHLRNFIECIRTRARPTADVEEGQRSTTFCHLGNIALETRSRLDWDPEAERVTNNDAANALLEYEYREPWRLG
ncbi:MAG: Gfo/Idh/MocA family oxidoreductase [Candidatus Omnitrophica bacterium]|nr:Gfo/Idh/MocA family oxidoreductase [Candidatus Omnitrophota bacterium]